MQELPRRLAAALGDTVRLEQRVSGIRHQPPGGWQIEFAAPQLAPLVADQLICCLPSPAAAAVLAPVSADLAQTLGAIASADIVSVHLGFEREGFQRGGPPLDGFGYLIPSREPGAVLGCLFASTCFPGHAPADRILVRFFVGGTRAPDAIDRDDQELVAECQRSLHQMTGVEHRPHFARVDRIRGAIPQYELGHGERLRQIDALLANQPGLRLLGAAYRGVSVGDLIRNGRDLAEQCIRRAIVGSGNDDAQHR
jgi:oxygen-dependent protoporphyrinogen oxidase